MKIIIGYLIIAFFIGLWPFTHPVTNYFLGYDDGYEDGWVGEYMRSNRDSYVEGYYHGEYDSYCYFLRYEKKDFSQYNSEGCTIK